MNNMVVAVKVKQMTGGREREERERRQWRDKMLALKSAGFEVRKETEGELQDDW